MKWVSQPSRTTWNLLICLLAACGQANAQMAYNFVEGESPNNVLATVEFSELPGDHMDIVSLVFTDSGRSVFGFGDVYLGTFDSVQEDTVGFQADFEGGLVGANFDLGNKAEIYDVDPPFSSVMDVDIPLRFVLGASNVVNFPSDLMALEYRDAAGVTQSIARQGTWSLVPEPNSASLCLPSVLAVSLLLRRKR